MSVSLITLNNVWKTYPLGQTGVQALRRINLSIKEGDFAAILGPSGSGKSTLMNLIGALDVPTKGTVLLKGKNIAAYGEDALAEIRGKTIGFIFQSFNLIPSITALENVTLPLLFQQVPAAARKQRGEELLRLVGLANRMHHLPSQLSGGQQQRVAVARALANDPEIILADEPTGNLDSVTGKQIIHLLSRLHRRENKTIILITHDKNVVRHATNIFHIKDGKIPKKENKSKKSKR